MITIALYKSSYIDLGDFKEIDVLESVKLINEMCKNQDVNDRNTFKMQRKNYCVQYIKYD